MSEITLPESALQHLRDKNKIMAVADVRAQLGLSLHAALQLVNDYEAQEAAKASIEPPATMREVMCLAEFQDGLRLASGAVVPASHVCRVVVRLDESGIHDGELRSGICAELFEQLYGSHWRDGNADGSAYVVGDVRSGLFNAEEIAARPWMKYIDTPRVKYWFYVRSAPGVWHSRSRETF